MKFAREDLILVGIIAMVGFGAFGLGRLSAVESVPISSYEVKQEIVTSEAVVASKNGSKYHFPWCSGAQRINSENLIEFEDSEKARLAGYTPAANCQGLK